MVEVLNVQKRSLRLWSRSKALVRSFVFATAFLAPVVQAQSETVLKFATTLPETSPMVKEIYQPYVDQINAAAEGEFEIQILGPTFANTRNVMDRVVSGVADLGILVIPATGLPFSRTHVTTLPMLSDNPEAGSVALWRIYERGLLADEFESVKVLNVAVLGHNTLFSKKPIHTINDLAGLKVRANDKNGAGAMTALGASPQYIIPTEAYQALSSGVVEAVIAPGLTGVTFKFNELAPYRIVNAGFGSVPTVLVMNKQSYERLSPKGKSVIDRFSGEQASRQLGAGHKSLEAKVDVDLTNDPAYAAFTLPEAELEKWASAISGVEQAWIESTPGGADVLNAYREELAKAVSTK